MYRSLKSVGVKREGKKSYGDKLPGTTISLYFAYNKLYAFGRFCDFDNNTCILISTFGSLSPILYVKQDLNFGRFVDFILSWS